VRTLLRAGGRGRGPDAELARLAEEYETGEVRLTTGQNVVLPNVPEEKLDALLAEPLLEELSPEPGPFLRGLVTCTGKSFCPFALIETKDRGRELADHLDERLEDEVREVMDSFEIHASGCANSCARPHTGSIGLIGRGIRQQDGTIAEAADVLLAAEQGLSGGFNERWRPKVPFEELAPMFEDPIRRYLAEREPAESFQAWCARAGVLSAEVRS
jgi:ferredoxin-nitrite reductase